MPSAPKHTKRHENDYYPTPAWCVRRLVEAKWWLQNPGPDDWFYEPFAGDGAIIRAIPEIDRNQWIVNDLDRNRYPELRKISLHAHSGDAFTHELPLTRYATIITNPPYSATIEQLQKIIIPKRHVFMLLPLSFLASATRAPFLRTHTPNLYVLPNRPSFTADGKTDSADYAWFEWHIQRDSSAPKIIQILADTPIEERRQR